MKTLENKKIALGLVAGMLLITLASCSMMNRAKYLVLANDSVEAELGQKVSTNIADYLDTDKADDVDKVIKNTKQTNNIKYVTVDNLDENGKIVSKEEKDYPEVGNYEISFSYKKEKATIKVTVKDTTKPEIKAPESIDVIQYTDLSTFNFGELLKATDYSDVKDWKIDTSKVDVNTIGSYELKVSIQDKYKNKATKKLTVNVVEAPAVAEGEVAVTEVVTDENGNKKTVVTKKPSSSVSKTDSVAGNKPVENKTNVESSANNATKPSSDSGSANTKPSGSTGSSKPSTDSNSNKPSHSHNWQPVTKTVHHAEVGHYETKTVQNAYDEPVYESHQVCKVCKQDFGKGQEACDKAIEHSVDTGHSYESKPVQVGTKHHDAITQQVWVVDKQAYDETVTTGYRCSCGAAK